MAGYNTTQNQKIASRAIISALVLWLAFCGMAAAEQLYVDESGWWRDGGVLNASDTPIQAAVDAADEGDAIYVWNGSYTDNVNVNKQLTLEGEGMDVVTVSMEDPDDHVFEVTADCVNLSGFTARGATDGRVAGIYLDNVDCCNISENNVYMNSLGIYMSSSSNNTLTSNTANSNNGDGIYLSSSSNNTLTSNNASDNRYGIYLLSSSDNNTLTSNNASDNRYGIDLSDSSDNTLTSNTASNNSYGINLISSSNNTLTSNTANSNNHCGIYLGSSSNSNTLTNNTALDNSYGISLISSSNNTLTSNNCSNNYYYGISLYSSSNNTLTSNTASDNRGTGIYLDSADNNNIACNLVRTNTMHGFYLTDGTTGSNISYNNIIENGNYNATSGGWEWQFYSAQHRPDDAEHNYWGAGMNSSTIDASIYDDMRAWDWEHVEFYPFETEPVPCAPTSEESHTFTTADAVIALQIAVGSRPFDSRLDVNGDNRVTSLDALMILHANAADSNT